MSNKWELVFINKLGSRERIIDTGLSYHEAQTKYDFFKSSQSNNDGAVIIRKAN